MQHLNYDQQENWDFITGTHQSPIALNHQKAIADDNLSTIALDYDPTVTYVRDTGASIEFGLTGHATLNHRKFTVQQAHLHTPSEHVIDGVQATAELHFVHLAADGQMAVVAVPVMLGNTNAAFHTIFDNIGTQRALPIALSDLLPEERTYLHYLGSLTTPPLTENVEWYVLDHAIQIGQAELDKFHQYYRVNNRKLQPDNDRPIEYFN